MKHIISAVNLAHLIADVRGNVDETKVFDFITHSLEALSYLKSHDTTITVTDDGIRTGGLNPLDCSSVDGHHFVHRGKERVTWLEATSLKSVEGTLVPEVLGKVNENEDLAGTGVHEENRCL